jgi:hypothetical protein
VALLLIVFAVFPSSVQAQSNQFGAPSIQRPTTSPYLNLLRGTNRSLRFGLNYQRRVRPELDLRANAARTNANVGVLQQRFDQAIGPDGSVILPSTGHTTSFMNTGSYFSGSGRPGGGQNRGAAGGQFFGMSPRRR